MRWASANRGDGVRLARAWERLAGVQVGGGALQEEVKGNESSFGERLPLSLLGREQVLQQLRSAEL